MEDVKAANDVRTKIKAEGQYQHLGTTSEEARLLEASTAKMKDAKEPVTLTEHAVEQGTRLHNNWDNDSVAADLQTRFGERPLDDRATPVGGVAVAPAPTVRVAAAAPAAPAAIGEGEVRSTDTPEALENKNVDELRRDARALDVQGVADMRKAELIDAIQEAQQK